MPVSFSSLGFGQTYEREFLARLWGYESHYAIDRGVVTPAGTNFIILFVTKNKQQSSIQYEDYIDGNVLFWEGELGHSADRRIVAALSSSDEIHLFYREIHHTPFVYFGRVSVISHLLRQGRPSQFSFRIEKLSGEADALKEVRERSAEYDTLNETEREQIIQSRLGQGIFRRNVVHLWGSCSVTGLEVIVVLRASHIKPWRDSSNDERLSPFNGLLLIPNYDSLLDAGYVTFTNDGRMLISKRLDPVARGILAVNDNLRLRRVFPESGAFLEYHRDAVFK